MAALRFLHGVWRAGQLQCVCTLHRLLGASKLAAMAGGRGWLGRRTGGELHDIASALSLVSAAPLFLTFMEMTIRL